MESLLAAPVGVGLLAALAGVRRHTPGSAMPFGSDRAAGEDATKFVADLPFGELLLVAVDAGLVRMGPWMSTSPANLTDAYRHAGDRRPIAQTIAERFGPALHLPLDVSFGEAVPLAAPHSGIPDVEVGIDVHDDITRMEQDKTVLRLQRG